MKTSAPLLHRLIIAIALPLLMAAPSAGLAAVRKAQPRVAVRKPTAPSNSIIALPLTPIVPSVQRLCSAKAASGLGYTMLRPGSGPKPGADATVLVNYIGFLTATGAVFDQNMESPLSVGGVIPGFSQGLLMMSRGAIIRLCIPAAMGYGAQASGPIPANSDLVFQVELLDFKTAAEMSDLRKAQAGNPAVPKDAPAQP